MRLRFVVLGCLAWLAVAAPPARAANGTIAITWDACDGPVQRTTSGPGVYSLYVTVLGSDVPHKAYEVRVLYGDANAQVPDAWRFDVEGCSGAATSALLIDGQPPFTAIKTCPPFMQQSTPSIQLKDIRFVPPTDPYLNTLMRLVLANSYPNGVATVDPSTRYHLARFVFDHANSVDGPGTPGLTCGGLESGMCFRLTKATYLMMDGTEVDFDRPAFPLLTATMNDIQLTACVMSPARPATWGQIKSQYRN